LIGTDHLTCVNDVHWPSCREFTPRWSARSIACLGRLLVMLRGTESRRRRREL